MLDPQPSPCPLRRRTRSFLFHLHKPKQTSKPMILPSLATHGRPTLENESRSAYQASSPLGLWVKTDRRLARRLVLPTRYPLDPMALEVQARHRFGPSEVDGPREPLALSTAGKASHPPITDEDRTRRRGWIAEKWAAWTLRSRRKFLVMVALALCSSDCCLQTRPSAEIN